MSEQTFRNPKWICWTERPFQICFPIRSMLNFLKICRTEQNFTGHVLRSCGFRKVYASLLIQPLYGLTIWANWFRYSFYACHIDQYTETPSRDNPSSKIQVNKSRAKILSWQHLTLSANKLKHFRPIVLYPYPQIDPKESQGLKMTFALFNMSFLKGI